VRELDDITGAIVDASLRIHRELGPGLLESVYGVVLARALVKRGFHVERHKVIRFEFEGMVFEEGFRIDLLVDKRVIVELKSVERLAPVHRSVCSSTLAPPHCARGCTVSSTGFQLPRLRASV
jgi:GxxExxY protein